MIPRRTAPDGLSAPVEIHEAGLASEPWSIVLVAVFWLGTGVGVAWKESRRGHELRHLVPLGIALGPLLIGFARTSLRFHESVARPVVLREVDDRSSARLVLVAVLGAPDHVADVRPLLAHAAAGSAHLALARPVTFDAARAEVDDPDRLRAARELEEAALFVHDMAPELLLIPGRGVGAVDRYLVERRADLVVVVDDDRSRGRGHSRVAIEVVVGPSLDDDTVR